MTSELKEKLGKAREAYLALSQPDKDEYLKRLTEKHGSEFVTGFMTFMENGDFAEMSSEEEMKTLFEKAKDEYLALSDEEKKAYMDTFTKEKGEPAAQAFLNYIEKGDFAEVIENIAELEPGKVEEGGTTLEEGYERSLMDILEVETDSEESEPDDGEFAENATPVKSLLDQYKEEYINMPAEDREKFFGKVEEMQGAEFVTALRSYLNEAKDFSERVNSTVQQIFDNAVKEFAEATNKGKFVTKLSKDFSESTSEGIVSYLSGELNDFSILAAAVEVHYVMKNFAEGEETPAEEPKVDNSQKFQNNEYLDVLVEKYKNLDDEAKTAMEAKMRSSVGDDLTDYIISRSKGEDFAEDDTDTTSTDEKPIDQTPPANEPAPSEDVDYESLSTDLFGKVYEVNPVEESKAKAKEVDIDPTLPEGLVTEGGTTLEENYDRELKEDFSECRWDSLAIMFN